MTTTAKEIILQQLESGPKKTDELLKALVEAGISSKGFPSHQQMVKDLSWALCEDNRAFFNDSWLLEKRIDRLESFIEACNEVFPNLKWDCHPYDAYCQTEFPINLEIGFRLIVTIELTEICYGKNCTALACLRAEDSKIKLAASGIYLAEQSKEALLVVKKQLLSIAKSINIPEII